MRESMPPTNDNGLMTHPAFGMIGASRVSGQAALYGSDFLHQHYVTIRVVESTLRRDVSTDWHHGGKQIIEVALSEAQWATFVSSMNVGNGVPCTIGFRERDGMVPSIEGRTNRRELHRVEIDQRLQRALALMDDLAETGSNRAQKEKARQAAQELRSNLPYIAERFDEEAEKTVEKAKIEVEAYLNSAVMHAGLTALGAPETLVLELPAEAGEDN